MERASKPRGYVIAYSSEFSVLKVSFAEQGQLNMLKDGLSGEGKNCFITEKNIYIVTTN